MNKYILVLFLCTGCAAPMPERWTNYNNSTEAQWAKDRYTCYQETQQQFASLNLNTGTARSMVLPACSALNACYAAHGYFRSDKTGTLVIPEVLQCVEN